MKLKSFNYLFSLLILLLFFSPSNSEDKIDIWKDNKNKKDIVNISRKNMHNLTFTLINPA